MFRRTSISASSTDEQLMQSVRNGDRRAFSLLYDRYFDKLVWFANSFLEDMPKSEDAIQEVFIKIMERPEQFDVSRKFSTWVYTVTGNACKNILRNELNRTRLIQENMASDANSTLQHQFDYRLLQKNIKTIYADLSEKERHIFVLRFEQELSIKEIAAIINIPEGSVKSGIYYLLKKMAVRLKIFIHEN
jgi:RNA polymerase sigma-70 factor (ECF subfamily)